MAGHKALFLSAPSPMTAAAMRGWLAAGNEISGLWVPVLPNKGLIDRDRRLAWIAPQWSTAAVVRRNRIPVKVVPRLAAWPERLNVAYETGADTLICHYFPFLVPDDMLAFFSKACGQFASVASSQIPRTDSDRSDDSGRLHKDQCHHDFALDVGRTGRRRHHCRKTGCISS